MLELGQDRDRVSGAPGIEARSTLAVASQAIAPHAHVSAAEN
jgi:hypothetical protein